MSVRVFLMPKVTLVIAIDLFMYWMYMHFFWLHLFATLHFHSLFSDLSLGHYLCFSCQFGPNALLYLCAVSCTSCTVRNRFGLCRCLIFCHLLFKYRLLTHLSSLHLLYIYLKYVLNKFNMQFFFIIRTEESLKG